LVGFFGIGIEHNFQKPVPHESSCS
jgi:hypothetical protein